LDRGGVIDTIYGLRKGLWLGTKQAFDGQDAVMWIVGLDIEMDRIILDCKETAGLCGGIGIGMGTCHQQDTTRIGPEACPLHTILQLLARNGIISNSYVHR
jgi:hypothetical protein